MKNSVLSLLIFFINTLLVHAQNDTIKKVTTRDSIKDNKDVYKLEMSPYYTYGKGLGITSVDSIYQVNIRFRMQNRITYFHKQDEDDVIDGQIRRLRLRLDGFVGNPKFKYSLQLSFAGGDVGSAEEGKNTNIIRDAIIYYNPNNSWSFGFGQTKLPGNRQRINSSGALQLTDRSINNASFNIDRDFGFQIQHTKKEKDNFSYSLRGAITTGEGRNWTKFKDTGLAYTGRAELFPLGAFSKDGSSYEGALDYEVKPKLMLAATYSYNNKSHRTQGQLGDDLYDTSNIQSLFLDAMLKYRNWSIMYAFMKRDTDKIFSINPNNLEEFKYIYAGYGNDFQASYMFPKHYELIGRYSTQKVDKEIFKYTPNTDQWSVGLTKYIWEHAFKLQAEFTYEKQKFYNNVNKNNWYARLQIEIGI